MQPRRKTRFLVLGIIFTVLAGIYLLLPLIMGFAICADVSEENTQEIGAIVEDAEYTIPGAESGFFQIQVYGESALLMVYYPESAEDPSALANIREGQAIACRIRNRDADAAANGGTAEIVALSVEGTPVITLESYNRYQAEQRKTALLAGLIALSVFGGIALGMYFAHAEEGKRFRLESERCAAWARTAAAMQPPQPPQPPQP